MHTRRIVVSRATAAAAGGRSMAQKSTLRPSFPARPPRTRTHSPVCDSRTSLSANTTAVSEKRQRYDRSPTTETTDSFDERTTNRRHDDTNAENNKTQRTLGVFLCILVCQFAPSREKLNPIVKECHLAHGRMFVSHFSFFFSLARHVMLCGRASATQCWASL